MTRQNEAVIILTPSISGISGASLVFHFYPHSALLHSPAAIFTSSYLSGAECRVAARLRWDNGVWHCFLVPVWIFCISAVYRCHLNLAFVRLTAQVKHSNTDTFQQCSGLKYSGGICRNCASGEVCRRFFERGHESPVSPEMLLGGWHSPLSAQLQRLLPDFMAELWTVSITWVIVNLASLCTLRRAS